jgi:N-methylhydantoinase A
LPDFHKEHERRYGYRHAGREVELVTLRLRAIAKSPRIRPGRRKQAAPTAAHGTRTRVSFEGKPVASMIYERDSLPVKKLLTGPAVITEYSATTVVPPGMRFSVDAASNLIIDR